MRCLGLLQMRCLLYCKQYLDEVKKSVSQGGRKKSRLLKISLFTRSKSDEMKQSYKQLRDAGVIISSDIAARAQKAISFRFTQPQPGLFRISASAAGVERRGKLPPKPQPLKLLRRLFPPPLPLLLQLLPPWIQLLSFYSSNRQKKRHRWPSSPF